MSKESQTCFIPFPFHRLVLAGALATCAVIIIGCGSSDTSSANESDQTDASSTCTPAGIGDAHPKHAQLQAILDKYSGEIFPGVSAVVATSDGVWSGASGFANTSQNIAMNPCHVVYSGSVAKIYTVTAAMRAVEDGLIGLDELIAPHLPLDVVQNLPNASLATVRQLMNHSAGMPDQDNDVELDAYVESNNGSLPSAQEQLRYLFDDPARFTPGTVAEYSSAHTLTLSLVLDSVSGAHHANLISNEIIGPLNLKETLYKNEEGYPTPIKVVAGYVRENGVTTDLSVPARNYANTSQGDAGVFATPHDFYLFLRALMQGRVVSSETVSTMLDPFMLFEDEQVGFGFGLGLFVVKEAGNVVKIGHGGFTLGGMTNLYYYPETDSYIALATNIATEDADDVAAFGTNPFADPQVPSLMSELEFFVR